MRILFPNLTFEDELSGRNRGPSGKTPQTVADLSPLMGYMADSGDCIVLNERADTCELPAHHSALPVICENVLADMTGVQLVPWGWSAWAVELAQKLGMTSDLIPSFDSVETINSRRFHHGFDRVLARNESAPGGVPFGRWCESVEQVEYAIETCVSQGYSQWVIKPRFSHAARNRLLGTSESLDQQHRGWLRRRLGDGVAVEPWVARDQQFGLQCHICSQTGESSVLGTTGLLTDHAGRYQGSFLYPSGHTSVLPDAVIRHALSVCDAASSCGYFGALGIDCFWYRDSAGQSLLRLCNDINGRVTMGRLALALRGLLSPAEFAAWIHVSCSSFGQFLRALQDSSGPAAFNDVRLISTSPEAIAGRTVRTGSLLVAGPDPAVVLQAVSELRRLATAVK